ncbi:MAG TPA: MraY family glycosyltransferase [Tepidisphaeraceae bacterium]|jgi:UDP-GlcNAc:undecaprenyl-phosphate GlcNAc-1-phosphate transferase|nr:MraY family glycosyltransferase [Tepidisphaeraceae bacterium]
MLQFIADEPLVGLRYFSADQVLSPYIYVFYAAYVVAFILTPVLRHVAIHYNIIDQPDGVRKMHTAPVAYLGGLAVFLGWLTGLTMSQFLPLHHIDELMPPEMPRSVVINFGLVIGASAIILLGLWDDIIHMSPKMKILGQVFAACCLLMGGIGRRCSWIFIGPVLMKLANRGIIQGDPAHLYHHWIVGVTSAMLVIGIIVVCCNATNLMDGLDGLCGGVTGVVAFGFLFLAVNLAMLSGAININHDALRVVMALALLGAVLGFVPYNFNPASIFLGDTGSMFIGFCCGTLMILFAAQGQFKWFLASMVMFSLPLLDTALAFVRRYVNKRPLFSADRYHLHHQLVARGFTVKQTVVISYGLSIAFVLLGAAIVFTRTRYAVGIYLIVFGSIIVAAFKMGMVHERVKVTTAQSLGTGDAVTPMQAEVEPGKVLEVKDPQRKGEVEDKN